MVQQGKNIVITEPNEGSTSKGGKQHEQSAASSSGIKLFIKMSACHSEENVTDGDDGLAGEDEESKDEEQRHRNETNKREKRARRKAKKEEKKLRKRLDKQRSHDTVCCYWFFSSFLLVS